ncbi:MAG: CopG family transcriptional regulator [Candidatus Hatepunaea meridiana]|nr:CopG family transcriptional regulator [Candidatus Hatepunaea meridiana]
MSLIKTATVHCRVNIPVSPETRSQMDEIASHRGVSLAELGRQALESYLVEARRQQRLQHLCETATKHADIIEGVAEEWQITEVEGWPDD